MYIIDIYANLRTYLKFNNKYCCGSLDGSHGIRDLVRLRFESLRSEEFTTDFINTYTFIEIHRFTIMYIYSDLNPRASLRHCKLSRYTWQY